jgi:ribosomal protein L39E
MVCAPGRTASHEDSEDDISMARAKQQNRAVPVHSKSVRTQKSSRPIIPQGLQGAADLINVKMHTSEVVAVLVNDVLCVEIITA